MPVTVWIPPQLRLLTQGTAEVQAVGATVDDLFVDLEQRFPGLRERVFDGRGEVRPFLGIFVNDEDIRFLEDGKTRVGDGDEVSIIPAVAGGR